MAPIEAIFIDDGDVMNDNARRGPQWQRLVGEYLAPRLGGDQVAWGRANKVIAEKEYAELGECPSRLLPHEYYIATQTLAIMNTNEAVEGARTPPMKRCAQTRIERPDRGVCRGTPRSANRCRP